MAITKMLIVLSLVMLIVLGLESVGWISYEFRRWLAGPLAFFILGFALLNLKKRGRS